MLIRDYNDLHTILQALGPYSNLSGVAVSDGLWVFQGGETFWAKISFAYTDFLRSDSLSPTAYKMTQTFQLWVLCRNQNGSGHNLLYKFAESNLTHVSGHI